MATSGKNKKESKNLRALFSIICLSVIALGMIVYFSTQTANNGDSVGKATTVQETTQVQNRVSGVTDTTAAQKTAKSAKEKKQTTQKQAPTEPTSMEQNDTNTPYKSFYKYPVSEKVLFGYTQELVKNETMGDYRAHPAVDFKSELGAEVQSINDGVVTDVDNDPVKGTYITIDHGGKLVAKYCGMDVINVSKGDYVTIGQTLGTLGTVPFEASSDAHLHFETIVNGEAVNPLEVMGKAD